MAVAAVIVLTVLSGVVHGYLDGRWSVAEDKQTTGAKLLDLPDVMGDWRLVDQKELDPSAERLLRCYGSVVRTYQHQLSDALVNFAVMYGPRGPIAVHTPEVCYSSVGTEQTRERLIETFETDQNVHRLWSVEFRQNGDPDPSLEVVYGWSTGDVWVAADNPRFWLTDDLYKIQVAGPVGKSAFQPCDSFIQALLPHLEQVIQQ
jgi:hypothetical protein